MNARSLTARTLFAGAAVTAFSFATVAQPPKGEPGQPGGGGGAPTAAQPPMDAKGMREMIGRMLDEHRQGITRLEDALKKLDSGTDPAAVRKEFLDAFRDGRRGVQGAGAGGNRGERGPAGTAGGSTGNTGGEGGGRMRSEYELTGPRLSDEDRKKVRALMDQKFPEHLQKVVALGAGNPEMTDRLIDGVGGRLRWIETMREKEPKEFDLRVKEVGTGLDIMKLGREITEAKAKGDTAAETAIRARLRVVMSERFDTRQQLNRSKIEELRKQAEQIEKTLAENDQKRDEVIDRRTDEFLKMMDNKGKKSEKAEGQAPAPRKP